RERLNGHADAVNRPLPAFQCTPFEAMARLAALPKETVDDRPGRPDFKRLRQWPEGEARKRLPLVEALQTRLRALGCVPQEHAFWEIGLEHVDPGLMLDLGAELPVAVAALQAATEGLKEATAAFGIAPPHSAADVSMLRACLERASGAPEIAGVAV